MGFWTGGWLFDGGFIGRTVPQLSTAVVMAQTQLRRPQVEPWVILSNPWSQPRAPGFKSRLGWAFCEPLGLSPPAATPWSSRKGGKALASDQDGLERTCVAERNFKVWPHQGRNLTLSSWAVSTFEEQAKTVALQKHCPSHRAGLSTLFRWGRGCLYKQATAQALQTSPCTVWS